VAEERARIARELHDIVAHGLSIIAVQAGAAQQLVERDPAAAREHLEAVHRIAKEAMTEMRRLLDVLREDDASYTPQPGLARVPELVEEARSAGVPVEVIEEGSPRDLPAGVDLVAYRVVQESLTNVRKHAPGAPTRIALDYEPRGISIDVSNEAGAHRGDSNGGGHGLVGMAERVRIFGGELETGEQPGGGFRVRVRLPLEEPPA
jgi:signal transduction histidine kinase